MQVIASASAEVRSGIVYATLIIVLVFLPLFALTGIEGRRFAPLGIACIVSILCSLLVAVTVTPVLSYWLLPRMRRMHVGDGALVRGLKAAQARLLHWACAHRSLVPGLAFGGVAIAAASVPFLPRTFLPPFNEGTPVITVTYQPGISLAESDAPGLIFVVLCSRYRSAMLALIIMGNVPLALIGAVAAIWFAGQPLPVATPVGFVTLTGIMTRNGILKVSHYLNLALHEGERWGLALVPRGSAERLTPALMTALPAGLALIPLAIGADAPGKEILHPVAITILGGLISATLLDTLVTPILFHRFGRPALERLRAETEERRAGGALAPESF